MAGVTESGLYSAASHVVIAGWGKADGDLKRCEQNCRFVEAEFGRWSDVERDAASPSQGASWLHENSLAVVDHVREVRQHLPRHVAGELPQLENGEPRVHALVVELLARTDGFVDEETLLRFAKGFQTVAPLTIGEIWAVPIMLRIGLIEILRRLALPLFAPLRTRWESDISGQPHLQAPRDASASVADSDSALDQGQNQGAERATLEHVVASFRLMSQMDWPAFFERVNCVEAVLREDPAHVYPWTDFETRDRCRHVVEQLARRTGTPDVEVARRAKELADAGHESGDLRRRHVGYYLIDEGLPQLEAAIGCVPPIGERLRRFVVRHATSTYLGGIGLFIVLGVSAAVALAAAAGGSTVACFVTGMLALLPASELSVTLVNYLVTTWLPPQTLPKLEFKEGVPANCPTMVAVPAMLPDEREISLLLERLERHFLANPDPHLSFALLTDFRDAHKQHLSTDASLLSRAVEGIRQLNERYRAVEANAGRTRGASRDRFFLFHRARVWNAIDKIWMGWERKRGKLIEFNRLLSGANDTSYLVKEGDVSRLPKINYVITLDADTTLPHGVARRLVGTLAHPLNRPQLSGAARRPRVTAGYTLLQPRIDVSLTSVHRSWYSWMFGNGAGLSPYVTASSDVYQDLFHEGSFVGKGIYDVAAFQATLDATFPENHILSHDLIEGCHARVGLVTDIALVDGFPTRYDADARRQHRWVRGDWQLLPWLLPRVPAARGWRKNPLSPISRWKVFDNLRRSVVPAALLLLLLAGWTVLPGSAWIWTLIALLIPTFPLLMDLTHALRSRPPEVTWHDQWRAVADHVLRTVAQTAGAMIFLPHRAQVMIDAAARALARMFRTHRRLLEWECAAATEHRLNGHRWTFLREMWFPPTFAAAAAVLAMIGALKASAWGPAIPLLAAWFCSPMIAHAISRPIRAHESVLTAGQRQWLWQIARKTWAYFQTHVGPEDHWLPPDNVRERPETRIVHRISPTNEGLFLVSALAAHDLGFLALPELADKLTANLDTWETLERHRGHHFNWYDTVTLQPLSPRYVSTVDSGNLAACLLTVQQGLEELASRQTGALRDRLVQLAERCGRMANGMDFRFLFDPLRRLFHIGFNGEQDRLDLAHYDLLASEARLASYVAIAKGDVDHRHWFQLGRGLTRVADRACLLSWSGSMFEYLMPRLFMRTVPGSLLDQTCRAAVARQIEYGRQQRVPWGISESSFAEVTATSDYGYQAFGVPGLGLQRDLDRDLVVAPYASALALAVDAVAAARNLDELARAGALGRYGFFDAVDYTPSRVSAGRRREVVPCYMAHHQGMSLIALANCLRNDCMPRRFHSHPAVRAAELLLEERVPEGIVPHPSSDEAPDESNGWDESSADSAQRRDAPIASETALPLAATFNDDESYSSYGSE